MYYLLLASFLNFINILLCSVLFLAVKIAKQSGTIIHLGESVTQTQR